jgi:MFS family permease
MADSIRAGADTGRFFGWYTAADGRTRRVFWACFLGWGLDAMDSLIYQYMVPLMIAAMGMTLGQAGAVVSANFFAAAIGGWAGGWLSDRFGRARILKLTILWFSIFSFLSGFAQNYEQLLVLRTLQGLGFGAEWAVGAVLLGEMIAPAWRGRALGTMQSANAIGSGLAAVLAGPVAGLMPLWLGWRVVFWIGLAPALLTLFIRRQGDESPLFVKAQAGEKRHPFAMFRRDLLPTTMLACLLSSGAQGAAFAVTSFLTTFLVSERGLSIGTAGLFVLLNSVGGFFGFLVNAHIADRYGRRVTFRAFAIGFLLAVIAYLYLPLGNSAWTLVPAGIVYGFFQFGIYAAFGPYFSELFPTDVRATSQAFAYNFGRATSFIFIQGAVLIGASLTLSVGMTLMGIAGMACALIATFLLPETRGRDLRTVGMIHQE